MSNISSSQNDTQTSTNASSAITSSKVHNTDNNHGNTQKSSHRPLEYIGRAGQARLTEAFRRGPSGMSEFVRTTEVRIGVVRAGLPLFDVVGVDRSELYRKLRCDLMEAVGDRIELTDTAKLHKLLPRIIALCEGCADVYPLLLRCINCLSDIPDKILDRLALPGLPQRLSPDLRLRVWKKHPAHLSNLIDEVAQGYVRDLPSMCQAYDIVVKTTTIEDTRARAARSLKDLVTAIADSSELYNIVVNALQAKMYNLNDHIFPMMRADLFLVCSESRKNFRGFSGELEPAPAGASDPCGPFIQAIFSILSTDSEAAIIKGASSLLAALSQLRTTFLKAVKRRRTAIQAAISRSNSQSEVDARLMQNKSGTYRGKRVYTLQELLATCLKRAEAADPKGFFRQAPWIQFPSIKDSYTRIIQHPMYFNKIKKRVREGFYSKPEDLQTDIHLIRENCVKFNPNYDTLIDAADKMVSAFEIELSRSRELYNRRLEMLSSNSSAEWTDSVDQIHIDPDEIGTQSQEAEKDTKLPEFQRLVCAIGLLSDPRLQKTLCRQIHSSIWRAIASGREVQTDPNCKLLMTLTQRASLKRWSSIFAVDFVNEDHNDIQVDNLSILEAVLAAHSRFSLQSWQLSKDNASFDIKSPDDIPSQIVADFRLVASGSCICQQYGLRIFSAFAAIQRPNLVLFLLKNLTAPLLLYTRRYAIKGLESALSVLSEPMRDTQEQICATNVVDAASRRFPAIPTWFAVLVTSATRIMGRFALKAAEMSAKASGSNVGALENGTKEPVEWLLNSWFPRLMLIARDAALDDRAPMAWATSCLPMVHYQFAEIVQLLVRSKLLSEKEIIDPLSNAVRTICGHSGHVLKFWNDPQFECARVAYDNLCAEYLPDFNRHQFGLPTAIKSVPMASPWGSALTRGATNRDTLTPGTHEAFTSRSSRTGGTFTTPRGATPARTTPGTTTNRETLPISTGGGIAAPALGALSAAKRPAEISPGSAPPPKKPRDL